VSVVGELNTGRAGGDVVQCAGVGREVDAEQGIRERRRREFGYGGDYSGFVPVDRPGTPHEHVLVMKNPTVGVFGDRSD